MDLQLICDTYGLLYHGITVTNKITIHVYSIPVHVGDMSLLLADKVLLSVFAYSSMYIRRHIHAKETLGQHARVAL